MGGKILADEDAVGLKFGRLTITARQGVDKRNHTLWQCLCDCGKTTASEMINLVSGRKQSCGCLKIETLKRIIHGACMPDAPVNVKRTFEIWAGMRKRCFNKKDCAYKWYGGRGIGISDEWGTFNGFVADMGLAPEGLTLERVDVNSGYCKSNCVWIALNKQAQNKTTTLWVTYDGITSCLKSLCSRLGVPYMRTYKRYRVRGWDLERALTQ